MSTIFSWSCGPGVRDPRRRHRCRAHARCGFREVVARAAVASRRRFAKAYGFGSGPVSPDGSPQRRTSAVGSRRRHDSRESALVGKGHRSDARRADVEPGRCPRRPSRGAGQEPIVRRRGYRVLQVVADRIAGATQTGRSRLNGQQPCCSAQPVTPEAAECPGLGVRSSLCPRRRTHGRRRLVRPHVLPSGQLTIVVGDVAGHGVQAAVVMGRIRSALRAYAVLNTSPAHVLDLVDRKVDQFETGTYATVACAVSHRPMKR